MSTFYGEQLRPFYDHWRARYPRTFTLPLKVREDSTEASFHMETGVELTGQPWVCVRQGYGPILSGQATHEIMGHMLRRILGDVWESFWAERFRDCPSAPTLEAHRLDANVAVKQIWAWLPVEIFAEAARIAFDPESPIDANTVSRDDRSMDWGCEINGPAMRAWFDQFVELATPPAPGGVMHLIDVRDQLPRRFDNDPQPIAGWKKTFIVVHYQGQDVLRDLDDFLALKLIEADAWSHITRDWSPEIPGVQGGGGIMYHELIAPSGTVFLVRSGDEWLWHCGDDEGNKRGYAIQVMCGPNTPPTPAQLAALEWRLSTKCIELATDDIRGHKDLSQTSCPGEATYQYVQEEKMFTAEDRRKLERVYDHAEAYEPMDWISALQHWLAKAIKSVWPNADLTGPDVKTGQPFKS